MSDAQNDARSRLQSAIDAADGIILGKNRQIRLALDDGPQRGTVAAGPDGP